VPIYPYNSFTHVLDGCGANPPTNIISRTLVHYLRCMQHHLHPMKLYIQVYLEHYIQHFNHESSPSIHPTWSRTLISALDDVRYKDVEPQLTMAVIPNNKQLCFFQFCAQLGVILYERINRNVRWLVTICNYVMYILLTNLGSYLFSV